MDEIVSLGATVFSGMSPGALARRMPTSSDAFARCLFHEVLRPSKREHSRISQSRHAYRSYRRAICPFTTPARLDLISEGIPEGSDKRCGLMEYPLLT